MEDESGALKRRELLKKAGVISMFSVIGTGAVEAVPKLASGNEPINLHFGSGNGQFKATGRRPRAGVTCTKLPDATPADGAVVIQTKTPPTCVEDYDGYKIIAWYKILSRPVKKAGDRPWCSDVLEVS